MNFDFSAEEGAAREAARRVLSELCGANVVRRVFENAEPYDVTLWNEAARLGWLGASIPEQYGGNGLGCVAQCAIAEELGRCLAPVPVASSIYLAAQAILAAGTEEQKVAWLPRLAEGSHIGACAFLSSGRQASLDELPALDDGLLSCGALLVQDGLAADLLIVEARLDGKGACALALVDARHPKVRRSPCASVDPGRPQAWLVMDGVPAEVLGEKPIPADRVAAILDRAAAFLAFEQLGGAEACLEQARQYALSRHAFGRPIGSFQAIKHRLADVYIRNQIARSNAYYGAWALQSGAVDLPLAAAAARLSAGDAFEFASRENIQVHGGIGVTWEMGCHLYYRRAHVLSLVLEAPDYWRDRLVGHLEKQTSPAPAITEVH